MDFAVCLAQANVWVHWVWPIALFLLGLCVVVFVHELGHFLLAKLVGIKVERFAIGFGPRLFGVRWGETDYCVCAIFLGGYVKMLGQEDFKPLSDDDKPDPRSYNAKSVGARFLVIAAGVYMNVLLAAGLFVAVGLAGKDFVAPVVGGVSADMPAAAAKITWQHGVASQPASAPASRPATAPASRPSTAPAFETPDTLQPGDRIVSIRGDSVILWAISDRIGNFTDLAMTAALADPEDKFLFTVSRRVGDRTLVGTARIGVKESGEGLYAFGVRRPDSTVVAPLEDLISDTPFQAGDRIVAIDGEPVSFAWDIDALLKKLDGSPVRVSVDRGGDEITVTLQPELVGPRDLYWLDDGTQLRGSVVGGDAEARTLQIRLSDGQVRTVPSDQLQSDILSVLGMVPRQRVAGVISGSPADKAGVQPGDILLAYGDQDTPTIQQVLEINKQVQGQETRIVVERDGKEVAMKVVPTSREGQALIGIQQWPDRQNAVVAHVRAGSPAAAGIPRGAVLRKVNGQVVESWSDVCRELSRLRGKKVAIEYTAAGQDETAEIPQLARADYDASEYSYQLLPAGTAFEPLTERVVQPGVWASLKWGSRETFKLVLSSYASLRSLIRGQASTKTISGPVGIGGAAVGFARRSFIDFVWFMGFLSAALAVFNFLPLPVVDGGHAVFLLIEKIRGRPLPVRLQNIIQGVGMALLLLVLVAVTWQDIAKMVSKLW
ncbi:MAG TPA: hypothetical protein DCX07_12655 [Phycisphaerales bacterium]|nr:hypothetical protein [Phycisphaerales bacterium]